jgi:hypothetical protein
LAETVAVSKSSISREAIEASTQQLEDFVAPLGRDGFAGDIHRWHAFFGEQHVIRAVGVDGQGAKHVLRIQLGATENAAASKNLLTHLRDQGLKTDQKYLFVIDGAKALRAAITQVFGAEQPVQRCRIHKMRNVVDHLTREQQAQVKSMMRAAYKLPAEEGMARMEMTAQWIERDYPEAARSLRERTGGDLDGESANVPPSPAPLPGDDQSHRELPIGGSHAHSQSDALARWKDGFPLGGWRLRYQGKEFSKDHWQLGPVGPVRHSREEKSEE